MCEFKISKQLISKIPLVRLGCLTFNVKVIPSDSTIKNLSETIIDNIQSELLIEHVSQKPTIKATKEAYRKLGKDPSRYRPSAEALTRRIVKGKDLYWINNVVDILNLISLESGFSIGGYDVEKINGIIEFSVGKEKEPYEAIGRGGLNIENLPLFRDDLGAFGSPTSDSLRTMITDETTKFLMIIIDFVQDNNLEVTMKRSLELYELYANADRISYEIIS